MMFGVFLTFYVSSITVLDVSLKEVTVVKVWWESVIILFPHLFFLFGNCYYLVYPFLLELLLNFNCYQVSLSVYPQRASCNFDFHYHRYISRFLCC